MFKCLRLPLTPLCSKPSFKASKPPLGDLIRQFDARVGRGRVVPDVSPFEYTLIVNRGIRHATEELALAAGALNLQSTMSYRKVAKQFARLDLGLQQFTRCKASVILEALRGVKGESNEGGERPLGSEGSEGSADPAPVTQTMPQLLELGLRKEQETMDSIYRLLSQACELCNLYGQLEQHLEDTTITDPKKKAKEAALLQALHWEIGRAEKVRSQYPQRPSHSQKTPAGSSGPEFYSSGQQPSRPLTGSLSNLANQYGTGNSSL